MTERHPSVESALSWLENLSPSVLLEFRNLFRASHNALSEECADALDDFLDGKELSDIRLIGLAWTMFRLEFIVNLITPHTPIGTSTVIGQA